MRVLIVSDLHSEFRPLGWKYDDCGLDYDLVICAGDVAQGVGCADFLIASFPSKPVVFVPGNHEYYNQDINAVKHIKSKVKGSNVSVLDRDLVSIQGKVFLGATLWTDLNLYNDDGFHTLQGINDFKVIKGMTKNWWTREHQHSLLWINENLTKHPNAVLVTHHFPKQSISEKYDGNMINSGFASDLESVFLREPALWVHGHTHDVCDYFYQSTRVVCNPLGYPNGKQASKPLVIEI